MPSHHGVGSYTSAEQCFLSLCLPCISPLLFLSLLHVSTSDTQELNILSPGPYYSDVEWWNQKPGLQLFGSSLKFFWQQPRSPLYLWPAIWNCFMKHITKILVFLLLFYCKLRPFVFLADVFSLSASSGWSIYFFKQQFLHSLRDSLFFTAVVHITLLKYWMHVVSPLHKYAFVTRVKEQ